MTNAGARLGLLLRLTLPVLALAGMGGCNPAVSIHPLYTDHEVTFDSALLGTWVSDDEPSEPIVIERADGNSYTITLYDSALPSQGALFNAHLVSLSGYMFLDAVREKKADADDSDDLFQIPGHVICRVWIAQGSLRLAYLEEDGVAEGDSVGKTAVDDFGTVLTGSTADLQRFVVEHADDSTVFEPGEPLFPKR